MFLYELALQLGERSTDLAERARGIGVDGAGPTTFLTADQVAALRPQGAVPLPPPPPPPPPPGAGAGGAAHPTPASPRAPIGPPRRRGTRVSPALVALYLVIPLAVVAVVGFVLVGVPGRGSGRGSTRDQFDLAAMETIPVGQAGTAPASRRTSHPEITDVKRFCVAAGKLRKVDGAPLRGVTRAGPWNDAVDLYRQDWDEGAALIVTVTTGSLNESARYYLDTMGSVFTVLEQADDDDLIESVIYPLQARFPDFEEAAEAVTDAILKTC